MLSLTEVYREQQAAVLRGRAVQHVDEQREGRAAFSPLACAAEGHETLTSFQESSQQIWHALLAGVHAFHRSNGHMLWRPLHAGIPYSGLCR